jgi:hypothetical protein
MVRSRALYLSSARLFWNEYSGAPDFICHFSPLVHVGVFLVNSCNELFRAAKQLTDEGVSHVLATVDATQERELATKYDIRYILFDLFNNKLPKNVA